MSNESTVERLKQFGYTALQFGFIGLVALHSGVFLRRLYRSPSGKAETIRYFVDKYPLFLSPAAVVHFTFVSAGGLPRLEEFRSHLLGYSKLFRHLKEVRLAYIHQDSFHISQAEACFHAMLSSPNGRRVKSPALLRYLQLRQAWERDEIEKVNSEGILYLNQSRK